MSEDLIPESGTQPAAENTKEESPSKRAHREPRCFLGRMFEDCGFDLDDKFEVVIAARPKKDNTKAFVCKLDGDFVTSDGTSLNIQGSTQMISTGSVAWIDSMWGGLMQAFDKLKDPSEAPAEQIKAADPVEEKQEAPQAPLTEPSDRDEDLEREKQMELMAACSVDE